MNENTDFFGRLKCCNGTSKSVQDIKVGITY